MFAGLKRWWHFRRRYHRHHGRTTKPYEGSDAFVEGVPHAYKAGQPKQETYNPSAMRRRYEGQGGRIP